MRIASRTRVLTLLLALLSVPLHAQGDAPGRAKGWAIGGDLFAAPGGLVGPTAEYRLKQWKHAALDARFDALFALDSEGGSSRKGTDRSLPDPHALFLKSIGLRWTVSLSDDLFGLVTASVADVRWALPRETRFTTGRIGLGSGLVLNQHGDAVELRVEALAAPGGSTAALVMGFRHSTRGPTPANPERELGGAGERTFRGDLRRTVSRFNFDGPTSFDGESRIGGGRGIAPGLSIRQRVARQFSVEAGVALVEKGYANNSSVRMQYAEVPLIANLELSRADRRFQWFVGGGLAPALLLSCEETNAALFGSASTNCGPTRLGTNVSQNFHELDLSRELRFGTRLRVGPGRIVGLVSTSTSLRNIDSANRERTTHTVGSWGIGYERSF